MSEHAERMNRADMELSISEMWGALRDATRGGTMTLKCCKCGLAQSLASKRRARRYGWGQRRGHFVCPWCRGVKARKPFVAYNDRFMRPRMAEVVDE